MPPDTPPSQTPPRRDLQAWREALLQVRLPLLSNDEEMARLLSPDIGLGEVQSLAEADLPLALELLAMAARDPRLTEGVRHLQQAVNVLGTGRTQALLRTRQSRPTPRHATAHPLALQAMATSALAALFVQAWWRQRRVGDDEQRRWQARLMGVVRWKLPHADPALAQRIEVRVAAGERRALVERELIGLDVATLNAWHLQDLGFGQASDLRQDHLLPARRVAEAARLGWTGATAPEVPKTLARVLQQPNTGSALAYALALELQNGWYSARARHWMAVASTHLGQPVGQVRHDLIQVALIAAQDRHLGLAATAAHLIWPANPRPRRLPQRRRGPVPSPTQAPAAVPAPTQRTSPPTPAARPVAPAPAARPAAPVVPPAPTTPPVSPPPARPAQPAASPPPAQPAPTPDFEQRCERAAFDNLSVFMREALAHLHRDMGLTRCALFLKQAGREELVCYIAHGFEPPVAAREMVLPLQADGLLTRLMQQPVATLWVKPHQVSAARSRLPAALAAWTTEAGCLMGTVQVRSHAMGLWWADVAAGQPPLDAPRLAQFGRMTQVFGAEFTRLLHLQRARPSTATAPRAGP